MLKVLGKGLFSKVVILMKLLLPGQSAPYYMQVLMCKENATGEILAMKIIEKDMTTKIAHALAESRVLQKTSNPFLAVCLPCCFPAICSTTIFFSAESKAFIPDAPPVLLSDGIC